MIKNNQESGIFIEHSKTKRSKYCCHQPFLPPPPPFLSPFFKTFVTHPPKINELDTAGTATPILRPDTPQKILKRAPGWVGRRNDKNLKLQRRPSLSHCSVDPWASTNTARSRPFLENTWGRADTCDAGAKIAKVEQSLGIV